MDILTTLWEAVLEAAIPFCLFAIFPIVWCSIDEWRERRKQQQKDWTNHMRDFFCWIQSQK